MSYISSLLPSVERRPFSNSRGVKPPQTRQTPPDREHFRERATSVPGAKERWSQFTG